MITFSMNGETRQATEGETVLEVALREGIDIPTLCYHPAVEPYGACRMCTVEVEQHGRIRLETSCTIPVREGMVVRTDTPDVYTARQTLMGLFLSRCPNVPLIQEMAAAYGVLEPPFATDAPDEKCILCGLCVRVCQDVVRANALSFSSRGIDRRVGPPYLESTEDCIGCGACAIVCPTDALEMADEREAIYKEMALGPTAAIYVPTLQAVPSVPVIDTDACIRFRQNDRTDGEIPDACGVCQMTCEAGAVDFEQRDEIVDVEVGAIVVATGYDAWDPTPMLQYAYGRSPDIITGLEFERMSNAGGPTGGEILTSEGRKPERVAILHCVGSRDEHYQPYCSRICCMYSLKLAHLVRDKTDADVFEFYMDIRAFGKGYEEFYERVQREGVVFVRGRGAQVLCEGGRLSVRAEDTELGRPVNISVDLVVLATAVVPAEGAEQLAHTLHVTRDANGFFLESHPKLRPVESNTEGIFLAGACQAPRDIPDTVAHAGAAASQALGLLSQDFVEVAPTVAEVRALHCVGCGLCVDVCPYGALELVESRGRAIAEINEALCKGCGLCVAGCRGKAISLRGFNDTQILTQLETLLQVESA